MIPGQMQTYSSNSSNTHKPKTTLDKLLKSVEFHITGNKSKRSIESIKGTDLFLIGISEWPLLTEIPHFRLPPRHISGRPLPAEATEEPEKGDALGGHKGGDACEESEEDGYEHRKGTPRTLTGERRRLAEADARGKKKLEPNRIDTSLRLRMPLDLLFFYSDARLIMHADVTKLITVWSLSVSGCYGSLPTSIINIFTFLKRPSNISIFHKCPFYFSFLSNWR